MPERCGLRTFAVQLGPEVEAVAPTAAVLDRIAHAQGGVGNKSQGWAQVVVKHQPQADKEPALSRKDRFLLRRYVTDVILTLRRGVLFLAAQVGLPKSQRLNQCCRDSEERFGRMPKLRFLLGILLALFIGATASSPAISALADGTHSTNVLAHGRLTSPHKVGAVAYFEAWLPSETLARPLAPSEVRTAIVGQSAIAADGTFAIRQIEGASLAPFVSAKGQLDGRFVISDGTSEMVWWTSLRRQMIGTRATWVSAANNSAKPTEFDFSTGRVTQRVPVDLADSGGSAFRRAPVTTGVVTVRKGTKLTEAASMEMKTGRREECYIYDTETLPARTESFANLYAWSGAPMVVTQSTGNDHTLGVTNSMGGWHTSGKLTLSFSAWAESGELFDKRIQNKVNYKRYFDTCYGVDERPVSYYDLYSGYVALSDYNYSYACTYKTASFGKSSGTNFTFTTGVDLPSIDTSAQAGWTSSRDVTLMVKVKARTKVCASSSVGWVESASISTRP